MDSYNGTLVPSDDDEDKIMEEMDEQDFFMAKLQVIKSYKERKKVFLNLSSIVDLEEAE